MIRRRDFLQASAFVAAHASLLSAGFASSAAAADKEDIAYLSAFEQIKRFKEGSLSPVDVLKAQIARIGLYNGPLNTSGKEIEAYMAFNDMVNCITYEHFQEAMQAAQESEQRYKAGTARPLEGITVAIKDEYAVKGWRVTAGAVTLQDAPPARADSPFIEFLRQAGAVMHIQTTVPEFYLNTQTWSKLWGVTRNPWNLHYAVGGSSGGSGAALAAGFTTLAAGSDIGGSIRIPSSFCGTYGFKPPFGRVATSETANESYGPMARTFEDMVLLQNAVTGPHPKVHSSLRPKLEYPLQYPSVKGIKIAVDYFSAWTSQGLDPAVVVALGQAASVLRAQGAIVDEVNLGWTHKDIVKTYIANVLSSPAAASMVGVGELKHLTSYVQMLFMGVTPPTPEEVFESGNELARLHTQLQETVFGQGYSALLMPTVTTTSIAAEFDPSKVFGGNPTSAFDFTTAYIWNLLNRYPVVNVPVGIARNNVPIGMQIVSNTYDDLAAFQVAAAYAQAGVRLYSGDMFPHFRTRP